MIRHINSRDQDMYAKLVNNAEFDRPEFREITPTMGNVSYIRCGNQNELKLIGAEQATQPIARPCASHPGARGRQIFIQDGSDALRKWIGRRIFP